MYYAHYSKWICIIIEYCQEKQNYLSEEPYFEPRQDKPRNYRICGQPTPRTGSGLANSRSLSLIKQYNKKSQYNTENSMQAIKIPPIVYPRPYLD